MKEGVALKRNYVPGSQMWFPRGKRFSGDTQLRGFGCGLVALEDFCIYRGLIPEPACREAYMEELRRMKRRYMPIVPQLGIAPYYLPLLINRYFRKNHMPVRIRRSFYPGHMEERIAAQLRKDLPVIFAAGPTIPLVFRRERLPLCKLQDGVAVKVSSVRAHYMTVVGLETDREGTALLKVASWGDFYYVKVADLQRFAKRTIPFTTRFYEVGVKKTL